MADIGLAYLQYLRTKTDITDIVGTGTSAKIEIGKLPQDASGSKLLPAIVIHDSISGTSGETLTQGDGTGSRRFQIDCYSEDRAQAESLRDKVRQVTSTYRGDWGSGGDQVFVNGASAAGLYGGYDDPKDGSDDARYKRSIDFIVHFTETVANPT